MSSASDTATETRGIRMTNSAMRIRGLVRALDGGDNPRRRRVDLGFERRGGGGRDEPCPDALDGRGEFTEALRLQRRHYFGSRPCELDRVMYDDGPAGAADRFGDRLDVERHQCAKVDDLGADPLFLQRGGGREGLVHAASVADQRDVGARPLDID